VDRRPVLEVVVLDAEAEDGVDHHRGDEREDRDADHDHEPDDEVDATGLAGGASGSQVGTSATAVATPPAISAEPQERDDGAPAHPFRSLDESEADRISNRLFVRFTPDPAKRRKAWVSE
jgi:hypothetical protein